MQYTSKNRIVFINGVNEDILEVYIVEAEFDNVNWGVVGVYTSFKEAYNNAVAWLNTYVAEGNVMVDKNYDESLEISDKVYLKDENYTNALVSIERFWLNEPLG